MRWPCTEPAVNRARALRFGTLQASSRHGQLSDQDVRTKSPSSGRLQRPRSPHPRGATKIHAGDGPRPQRSEDFGATKQPRERRARCGESRRPSFWPGGAFHISSLPRNCSDLAAVRSGSGVLWGNEEWPVSEPAMKSYGPRPSSAGAGRTGRSRSR